MDVFFSVTAANFSSRLREQMVIFLHSSWPGYSFFDSAYSVYTHTAIHIQTVVYKLCDIFATGQIQFHKHDFVSTTKMAISTPVVSERGFPDIIKAHGKILHREVSV